MCAMLNACDSRGEPLLFTAIRNHNVYLAKLLILKGANCNFLYCGDTPLTIAIKQNYVDIAESIVKVRGVDIELRDVCGETPLAIAAMHGHQQLIRLLLEAEANPHVMTSHGEPLCFILARKNLHQSIHLLMDRGVSLETRDKHGRTLLYYLAQHRCEDSFIYWVRHGIPFDNPHGYPGLLEVATEGCLYFAVKSILMLDARLRTRSSLRAASGERLIHVAFRRNHTLLGHLFLTWEAATCIQRAWARYKLRH